MNITFPFQKKALALALGSCFTVISPITHALVLNADADYSLPGVGASSSASDGPSATQVDAFIDSPFTFFPDGASAAGRGNSTGWMYSRAGGGGSYTAGGHIQQRHEMTNTSLTAMAYSFDFTISQGSLSTYNSDSFVGSEHAIAAYNVAIKLNNNVIWESAASLLTDATGSSLVQSGTPLGTYSTSNFYSWGVYTDTLSLGVFNPGDSFVLEYDIFTEALGDTGYVSCGNNGYGDDGYGGDFGDLPEDLLRPPAADSCSKGSSYAQFGDPNGFSSMPINNSTVVAAPVPEPGALLLMAGGAAGLAYARRRKSRSK